MDKKDRQEKKEAVEREAQAYADGSSKNSEYHSSKKIDFEKLKSIQRKVAQEVSLKDKVKLDDIKTVGGFSVAYEKDVAICAAVVLDYNSLDIVEKAYSMSKAPMPYVPSFLAFREGPAIIDAYEKLNIKPDVIIIEGHGVLHPLKSGLATYVGVMLKVSTIGVAKKLLTGHVKGTKVYIGDIARGEIIKTKEHAKPLFVSSGTLISTNSAIVVVNKTIKPPHKLPEPLHVAARLAKAKRDELRQAETKIEKAEKDEAKEQKGEENNS